jgi:putative transposase
VSDQLRVEDPQYPLAVVWRVLETPRSSVYMRRARAAAATRAADIELQAHIERIAGQWPTYGYRRVAAQLRRERDEGADAVNGKRVRRRMSELGLVGHAPTRRCRTTNSDQPYARYPHLVADLVATQPDAVWVADIT